jgi:hypothetical protein
MPKSLKDRFDAVPPTEFNNFGNIAEVDRPCQRPDLCAFLKLEALQPGSQNLISCADHDVFYLDADVDELNMAISDADILYLCRCGVSYSPEHDVLFMLI